MQLPSNTLFAFDYDMVLASKDHPAICKLLVVQLRSNPYIRVGEWLKNLTDPDLQFLTDLNESISKPEPFNELAMTTYVALTGMLAAAEGVAVDRDDDKGFMDQLKMLSTLVTMESLFRKQLVDFIHANATLGDDQPNDPLAKLVDPKVNPKDT